MFRPKIVPRPNDGGRRATGDIPDALRGVLHHEALARDLGIDPKARQRPLPAHRSSIGIGTIIGVLFVAVLMFALILTALLWRDGRLAGLFPGGTKTVASGPKTDWILSGHAPRIEEATVETSNSLLPLAAPVGPQPARDAADDDAVETDEE